MLKKLLLSIVFILFLTSSDAQPFNNSWINPSQKYFKIKVAEQGIFRLDYFKLSFAMLDNGMNITTVDPRRIQLFHMGKEIPIYVHGENDGAFNFNDFIEFYGTKNDGKLDADMYENKSNQLHQYYSLITDTTAYFLTVSATQNGKRLQSYSNNNYSIITPETYFIHENYKFYTNQYYGGLPLELTGITTDLAHAEYNLGESWIGQRFGVGSSSASTTRTENLETPFLYTGGPTALAEFKVMGITNFKLLNGNDHHLRFSLSKDNLLFNNYFDSMWNGHGLAYKTFSVPHTDIGTSNTYFRFETIDIPGITANDHAISYIKIKYPRQYNLNGSTFFRWALQPNGFPRHIKWEGYGSGSKNKPIVYDITNGYRIRGTMETPTSFKFIIPASANEAEYVVYDSTDFKPIEIAAISMFNAASTVNNTEFLIVTSKKLKGKETDEYLTYRSQKYASNLVTVEELYDAFSYGVTHPLAIRYYCDYLIKESDVLPPRFLMLIGRGYQTNLIRTSSVNFNQNLVPSIGVPASDNMFTSGLNGTTLEPALATGRIAVDKKSDIASYLDKLKTIEQSTNDLWKKDIMHLGGGIDGQQSLIIKAYLSFLETIPIDTPFGGYVVGYYKSASGVVEPLLKQKSITEINDGKSLITFLGHGSTTILDLDIGDTTDYLNYGRYPVMYINGCSAGNPCVGIGAGGVLNYSEKLIRSSDKGAVIFIGQSNLSELGTVWRQMRDFYFTMFQTHFGNTIGEIVKETIKRNQIPSDGLNRNHQRILFVQGDPAFQIYSPDKPDYSIQANGLYLEPYNMTALSDSFDVAIIVSNVGKYTTDSFEIELKRSYPNNSQSFTYRKRFPAIGYKDTVYFTITSKDITTTGFNTFEVNINPDRNLSELYYGNNYLKTQKFIPGNGINLIFPARYGIVASDSVTLTAQSLNILIPNNQYTFEIDTSHKFNSPWKKSVIVTGTASIANWKVKIFDTDSTVYYWRAKLNLGNTQGGYWEERSFIYIKNHPHGWSQSHFPQFYPTTQLNRIVLDSNSRMFRFAQTERRVWVDIDRNDHSFMGVKLGGGFESQTVNPGVCKTGIVVVLFDRFTLERKLIPTIYPDCFRGAEWAPFSSVNVNAYYTFDTRFQSERDKFKQLVDAMNEGDHIALFSRYGAGFSTWDQQTYDVLKSLGALQVDGLRNDNAAYVMVGTKGHTPGQAYENIAIYQPGVPGSGYAFVEGRIFGRESEGSITSEAIGPAASWGALYFYPKPEGPSVGDDFHISVYGIKPDNKDTMLASFVYSSPMDLSFIDSNIFRRIYLKGFFKDDSIRTPPQLKHWRVTYNELPEGILNQAINFNFHSDTLQEGDSLRFRIAFQNISVKNFDSVLYKYSIYNIDTRDLIKDVTAKAKPLSPQQYFFVDEVVSTTGLSGRYAININVNPAEQPEQIYANNATTINFVVVNDRLNPLLDVTFDGKHITDGEIVAPSPLILISSKDENKYLLQNDTSKFEILLKRPGIADFERMYFSSGMLQFFPAIDAKNNAKVEFKPQNLPNGIYTLRVQSKDMTDNKAGSEYYEIRFQVINESSITNLYPYPNPFTTSMRFVFTLTGTEIPDYINIKIMTVTGKVVREITKEDLGNITIGNNISSFTWDGTDEFGDRLANGVYMYKVTIRHNGKDVELRESAGDASFKDGMGKIYLLR